MSASGLACQYYILLRNYDTEVFALRLAAYATLMVYLVFVDIETGARGEVNWKVPAKTEHTS